MITPAMWILPELLLHHVTRALYICDKPTLSASLLQLPVTDKMGTCHTKQRSTLGHTCISMDGNTDVLTHRNHSPYCLP